MFLFFLFNTIILVFLAPKVGNPQRRFHSKLTNIQIIFPPRLSNKELRSMIEKTSKADGNHTIAANVVFNITGIMLSKLILVVYVMI